MSQPHAIPELPEEADKAGLFYRASNGWDVMNLAIDPHDKIVDPREKEYCRAFLLRALTLLDSGDPRRRDEAQSL